MERRPSGSTAANTYSDSPTTADLMAEFRENPEAYMERRAEALRGDTLYKDALDKICAEDKEALRAFGRRALRLMRHPFSHQDRDDSSVTQD